MSDASKDDPNHQSRPVFCRGPYVNPLARHARSVDESDVESDDPPGAVLWLRARHLPYGPMSRKEEATPVPPIGSAAAGRWASSLEDRQHLSVDSAIEPPFDVAIVGGGPAGLAASLILGRMRRRVLLLDADDPAHGVSEAVHGLFAHDGTPPL